MKRDFLKLGDFSLDEHMALFRRTAELKQMRRRRKAVMTLVGRALVLIFEKSSTRTRVSFELAMTQLGGDALTLPVSDSQMARGEPLSDTARVLSRYADAIMVRTFGEERLFEFAKHATVPVVNGLTDQGHPVQVLADLYTMAERFGAERLGELKGRKVAFVGDGLSNMARSWMEAAGVFGVELHLAAPKAFRPSAQQAEDYGGRSGNIKLFDTPEEACRGVDVVTTDVWISMGQDAERELRRQAFGGYCVDERLLSLASPEAFVLHCLPAHRGEEISAAVLEGPRSAVWDEAENRLHVQKALLEKLILDAEKEA
ncbi:MAG: ornithine carbamoyltransferase [Cystobacterineae bacterium]|nr:ornithine carbamoyltransferase [Cystobacterineae bacterium]